MTLKPDEAKELVEACERYQRRPNIEESFDLVRLLLGSYPNTKAHDPDIYTTALSAVFVDYPVKFGREVCRELPRTCKFLPNVNELTEALENKVIRRKSIHARAKWIVQQSKIKGPDPKTYISPQKAIIALKELKQAIADTEMKSLEKAPNQS